MDRHRVYFVISLLIIVLLLILGFYFFFFGNQFFGKQTAARIQTIRILTPQENQKISGFTSINATVSLKEDPQTLRAVLFIDDLDPQRMRISETNGKLVITTVIDTKKYTTTPHTLTLQILKQTSSEIIAEQTRTVTFVK